MIYMGGGCPCPRLSTQRPGAREALRIKVPSCEPIELTRLVNTAPSGRFYRWNPVNVHSSIRE